MAAKQAPALEHLTTEAANPASVAIDSLSGLQIVRLMNAEDANVARAVGAVAESIATAIDVIADRLRTGGRLIYIGAGTSGRLGVLDASECPPTFSTPPELVVGLIAGGRANDVHRRGRRSSRCGPARSEADRAFVKGCRRRNRDQRKNTLRHRWLAIRPPRGSVRRRPVLQRGFGT
jgi:hypothetical protein